MFAVLASTDLVKKGIFSIIFGNKITIEVLETAIHIELGSFQIAYCFPVCETFAVSVTLGHVIREKKLSFREGREAITFVFNQLSITLVFSLHLSLWDFYENVLGDTPDIPDGNINGSVVEGQGVYQNRRYFVNQSTLETSFSCAFPSLQKFPSFSRIECRSRVFYTDSTNKIVIGMCPLMKRSIVKNKVWGYFSNRGISKKLHRVKINRKDLLRSSFRNFLPVICVYDILDVVVAFDNEIGEDHGAIRREYIYLLFQELVRDQRLVSVDGVLDVAPGKCAEFLYEYSIGEAEPDRVFSESENIAFQAKNILEDILSDSNFLDSRAYFILLGAVIGCILLLRETFQVNFSLGFYENLLTRQFTLRHVQDTELQRNLLKNLHGNVADATGVHGSDILGSGECFGAGVNEIVEGLLFESKRDPYNFIKFGFDCMVKRRLTHLTAFEFPFIFYHFEPISLGKLRDLAVYDKCNAHTKEVVWLWEIMENKQQSFLSRFLLFVTGSGNLGMFDEDSAIYFEKIKSCDELFKASSCSKRLYIPSFETRERMEYFLDYSILNTEGFHKV